MPSITTRAGSDSRCAAELCRLEEDRSKGRQGECEGMALPVAGHVLGVQAAGIAEAAAAVVGGIAVQQLAPVAAARHAEAVVVARHGREIEDDENVIAQECQHALLPVAAADP